jgi:trans-L-3-hydroxyproline dehydratase
VIRTVDAHAGGHPLRLIVDGMPSPAGRTILEKREWLRRHADHLRRAVVLEPRGHEDMVAALLTEPGSPDAHAGIVFMDAQGYPAMSGHGVIAVATLAVERSLFFSRDDSDSEARLVFDTPAGTVHARVRLQARGAPERRNPGAGPARRVDDVAFMNVPSFVHTAAHPVRVGTRALRVDVAFGGLFYAIVDTEAVGIPLTPARVPDLRRLGVEIRESIADSYEVAHPAGRALGGVEGVVFTGPPQDPEAHLQNVAVVGRAVRRSPSGTATSALMAVLDAMGLLGDSQTFVHESLTGALFRGRIVRRTEVGDRPAIVPEVSGTAWITGEHTFLLDDDDPFREGFVL